jgi:TIR domain
MSKIVVSYRRSDSQAIAGRIVDRLIAQFGEQSVFMDVDNIPFGIDFRQHIQSVLSQAEVLIAVVGPDWLGAGPDGKSRIQEEDDPVRVEIETALRQEIMVIPVLVNGAGMPKAAALPDSLEKFAFLNAAPIDVGRDFRPHVDRLVQSIDEVLARKSGRTVRAAPKPVTGQAATAPSHTNSRVLGATLAAVLLLAGGAATWELKVRNTAGSAPTSAGAVTPSADEAQWAQLKDTRDIGLLRQFIEQYPESKHRADAEHLVLGLISQPGSSAALTPGGDEDDWTLAKTADTFDAFQAYLKAHPQGEHIAEANQAAAEVRPIANALKQEPGMGVLLPGHTAIVDDHDPMCKRGFVKVVTGGDVTKVPIVYRTKKCVPRDQFP